MVLMGGGWRARRGRDWGRKGASGKGEDDREVGQKKVNIRHNTNCA